MLQDEVQRDLNSSIVQCNFIWWISEKNREEKEKSERKGRVCVYERYREFERERERDRNTERQIEILERMRSIFRYVITRLSICTLYAQSLIRQRETDENTEREKKRDKEIKAYRQR